MYVQKQSSTCTTEDPVTFVDVYKEFEERIAVKYGINKFKSKVVLDVGLRTTYFIYIIVYRDTDYLLCIHLFVESDQVLCF